MRHVGGGIQDSRIACTVFSVLLSLCSLAADSLPALACAALVLFQFHRVRRSSLPCVE